MRVLFVANPEKAHVLAMLPLAWALRTAGHEVRVAGTPWFADVITQAGLTAVPVGRDYDLWKLLHRSMPGWTYRPEFGLPTPYDVAHDPDRADWAYLSKGYADIVHLWHKPASFPMIAALADFARHWKPDLVLWEPLAMAGPIAAKACGAAHGRLLWSLDVFGVTRENFLRLRAQQSPGERTDPLGEWLGGYARMYGGEFTEDMVTGQFTVDQMPASVRLESALPTLPMRFVPYGGPAVVPKWLWTRPERPRVALTMGLSATDHDAGYEVGVQEILDSLADLDVEVVATIAESEQDKLVRVPANARLVSYVPLHALAPTCSLVIHHGGYGTFLTMAREPVPQLVMPWDFDGPTLARRAAEQGGSLVLQADRAAGAVVREAVLRLLDDPEFRSRAAALRDEIHAMPSPNELVPRLEALSLRHRVAD
ncbi:activator-dependent family glycosyltransferase [Streptomyces phaeolivaceus]|uniref:Activator-dependent family glycosyltransferase n=1 Tax=Streptomyces phaeolivaceus TaxID=2653200 RepID=A0A5P8KIM9_9ACTN|nr:activator-dependent family glycosyltransferase [Streptomyces phaeolivaceus]QFR02867.1 activator-dependent family glycosyltransferase [Streptomyces phaeolivaceus]